MNAHILRVFSERSFLFLWIGEVFTQISTNLFYFFLILIVFKLTHSNTAVSGVVLSFTIPAIFFGTIAGAYVDRWDKKHVLIVTNSVRAILLILMAFALNNVFFIYLISFLFSILVQFFIPAESPMIPLVVKKQYLMHANALFGLAIFGSILVAYVLSGPILILFQPFKTVLLFAAMLLVGALFISFIKPAYGQSMKVKKKIIQTNIFTDMKQTLAFMRRTRVISHSLFLLSMSQILILILATIAPGYAAQVLGIPVEQFSIIFVTPAALGMVIGSLVLINLFHNHPKQKLITIGIFLSGIAMLLLPFGSRVASREVVHDINLYLPHAFTITILHFMVVLAFVLGLANSLVFVPANTRLQENTSEEIRGKIYGLMSTLVGILSLVPIILVGGLSDLIGVGSVIIGIGISLLILGIVNISIK
ncbi:MAG TPA: MFS transporter [Candidatus Sulfotelmatobacter sp.]|jgi:MFS family permease|nr:MFS transporter [Candidatus Sulfotelmatobacter sp.]